MGRFKNSFKDRKGKIVLKFASGWILSYLLINILNSPYIETMIHPSSTGANNIFNKGYFQVIKTNFYYGW